MPPSSASPPWPATAIVSSFSLSFLITLSLISAALANFLDDGRPARWREPFEDPNNLHQYYECSKGVGCEARHCPGRMVFDRKKLRCLTSRKRSKRQTAVVGATCTESTQCRRGAYCDSTKRCACLSTYTEINGYCWQKINPGQSGCEYAKQCSSVWPNAYCSSGTCKCGNNAPSYMTRDGPVCVNYGYCPVNGQYTKLTVSGTVFVCLGGSDSMCPTDATSYECICGSEGCADGTGDPAGYCCPSRAQACIMAQDSGTTPTRGSGSVTRYYHNPITGNCETFQYRGAKGNANNFETKDQCESYCVSQSCERGNPRYQPNLPNPKDTVLYCTGSGSNVCGTNHDCKQIGSISQCCPKASFICSKQGGLISQRDSGFNYDMGIADGVSSLSFSRWYYDEAEKRCLSFTYTGQAGNYNNFLSESHCDSYCAKATKRREIMKTKRGRRRREEMALS